MFWTRKQDNQTSEDKAINDLVDHLLNNANINLTCMPDRFEKKMYVNLIKIIFGNVKELLQTTTIEFFNHRCNPTKQIYINGHYRIKENQRVGGL